MSELRQRRPRLHDEIHLRFVRMQKCCIKHCCRPAEAAHVRMACPARGKEPTGMQEKPDDCWTVPLCGYHHRDGITAQHKMGEADFWQIVGLDPFAIALKLWEQSGGAARTAVEKPVKRRRGVKARKPVEMRVKVAGPRRTIPGRRFDGTPIFSRTIAQ